MMLEEKIYKYSGKWITFFLGALIFGSSLFFFYYKALYNKKGLIINNIIELNISEAKIFYWILFTLSFLMTLGVFYGIYSKIKRNNYLIIDNDKIIIPTVGFQKKAIIVFRKISKVNETKINGNTIFTIYFENKKRSIVSSLFSKKKEYLEVKDLIMKKINQI